MYNESTTIVDAVATTDGYALSIKAGDLYIAYEVVRRHVDEAGARHFAQLTKSEITEDGYAFTFDTGDVFTCTGADEYPASETLSDDSSGGGSGGGVLVVNVVYDEEKDNDYTDKTWKEIYDAPMAVLVEIDSLPDGDTYKAYYLVSAVEHKGNGEYSVYFYNYIENPQSGEITIQKVRLVTDSENGYLTYAE